MNETLPEFVLCYRITVLEDQVFGIPARHMTIERVDGMPVRGDWDLLQALKNAYLGEESTAIEYFPAEADVVNETNRRHLWEVPPGAIPLGMDPR